MVSTLSSLSLDLRACAWLGWGWVGGGAVAPPDGLVDAPHLMCVLLKTLMPRLLVVGVGSGGEGVGGGSAYGP